MTVNAGMRDGYLVAPVDWAYNHYLTTLMGDRTGIYEPLRYYQNPIKGWQQRDRGEQAISISAWGAREVSPWRVYSDQVGNTRTVETLNTYQRGLRARVTNSMLTEWLRKVNEYQSSDWPRTQEIAFNHWAELDSVKIAWRLSASIGTPSWAWPTGPPPYGPIPIPNGTTGWAGEGEQGVGPSI